MTSKSTNLPWRRTKPSASRSWLRSSTRNPENPALELLRRALKAATSSRNRLTRLAPSIFSLDAEAQDSWEEDKAWLTEYAAMVYRIHDEKKGLPPKAQPSASEKAPPARKGPGIPEDEKGTPLECHAFQSLAAEKKAVIKDAFLAWQTWDRNVRKHKQEFETRNPKWQEDDSHPSAELRELWSRYNQSLLGLSSTSGKGSLDDGKETKQFEKGFDRKKFLAEELEKYGPPPEGVSVIEHIVRAAFAADEKAKAEEELKKQSQAATPENSIPRVP